MKEAIRYISNAREILKSIPVMDNTYLDAKPVRKAFGVAYLPVLMAIDEYHLSKGLTKKELSKSVDAYRSALRKYLAVRDGKLVREFEALYEALHIAGYYRGNLLLVDVVKDAIKSARSFVEKIP